MAGEILTPYNPYVDPVISCYNQELITSILRPIKSPNDFVPGILNTSITASDDTTHNYVSLREPMDLSQDEYIALTYQGLHRIVLDLVATEDGEKHRVVYTFRPHLTFFNTTVGVDVRARRLLATGLETAPVTEEEADIITFGSISECTSPASIMQGHRLAACYALGYSLAVDSNGSVAALREPGLDSWADSQRGVFRLLNHHKSTLNPMAMSFIPPDTTRALASFGLTAVMCRTSEISPQYYIVA